MILRLREIDRIIKIIIRSPRDRLVRAAIEPKIYKILSWNPILDIGTSPSTVKNSDKYYTTLQKKESYEIDRRTRKNQLSTR